MTKKKKRAGNLGPTPPAFHGGNKRSLTKAEMQALLKEAVENTPVVLEEDSDAEK
jgi:hypothetical protein